MSLTLAQKSLNRFGARAVHGEGIEMPYGRVVDNSKIGSDLDASCEYKLDGACLLQ